MFLNYYNNLQYTKLGIYVSFCLLLSIIILILSMSLTLNNPDSEKLSTYECGFEPYEDARDMFDVRFYLVAILFLIFDLETVYLFPWCVSLFHQSPEGLYIMFEFFFELTVGFVYAWSMKALDWN